MPHQYSPITIEGEYFHDYMLPTDSPDAKELFATAKHLSRDPRDSVILEASIERLFKEAFDIDIKTCTEGEWAERITMKGGALKQWQSLLTVPEHKKISSNKASLMFIAFSIVLLIGISLLPKSIPLLVPSSSMTVTATATR